MRTGRRVAKERKPSSDRIIGMCGICGIWGKPDPHALGRMVEAMRHRGPDDEGIFQGDMMSLGMTRLSVIDLSPLAHQPMSNPEKTIWIVYNGEMYNFKSERQDLEKKGHTFSSQSDTEVALHLYEEYGDDFLLRMRGMFALAIYDRRRGPGRERLLLARDHVGIKPLLFARAGGRLLFASELKALLASRLVQSAIDPEALRQVLAYGSIQQPRTMLRGVNMLLPAHRLVVEKGRERNERYWSLGVDRRRGLRSLPYEVLVDEVASAVQESVRLHLVSDVPVGAFLSSGVDSSLLVGIMARIAGNRVKTFSVGFDGEEAVLNETEDAERTARFCGAEHTHVIVRGEEVRDRITDIAKSLDQPSVNGVNIYLVSAAARQAVTVAISGTGGDELFAGYPWFTVMQRYQKEALERPLKARIQAEAGRIAAHPLLDPLLTGIWGSYLDRARSSWGFTARYAGIYKVFGPMGAAKLLSPEIKAAVRAGWAPLHDYYIQDELPEGEAVERVTALCLRGYTSNQLLRDIDVMSMAHSLEVRVPLLDVPLIELSLSLPPSVKLEKGGGVGDPFQATYRSTGSKRVLIDSGLKKGFLRDGIDLQPKKGFTMPFYGWLRGPLREVMEDTLSDQAVRQRGLFSTTQVGKVRKDFLAGKTEWYFSWLLMITELWCREVLDGIYKGRAT